MERSLTKREWQFLNARARIGPVQLGRLTGISGARASEICWRAERKRTRMVWLADRGLRSQYPEITR